MRWIVISAEYGLSVHASKQQAVAEYEPADIKGERVLMLSGNGQLYKLCIATKKKGGISAFVACLLMISGDEIVIEADAELWSDEILCWISGVAKVAVNELCGGLTLGNGDEIGYSVARRLINEAGACGAR